MSDKTSNATPTRCEDCDGLGGHELTVDPYYCTTRWERCARCDGWGYDRPSLVAWVADALRTLVEVPR